MQKTVPVRVLTYSGGQAVLISLRDRGANYSEYPYSTCVAKFTDVVHASIRLVITAPSTPRIIARNHFIRNAESNDRMFSWKLSGL